jgi:thioredoxin-like negative regulator of GroEL
VIVVLLAPAIAALLIGIVAMSLRVQQRGQLQLVGRIIDSPLGVRPHSEPSVLFFSSTTCAICHTAQRPALDTLVARSSGRLAVREIDVAAEPDVARSYRVMSLPTTIVLGAEGDVTAINVGFASAEKLAGQLARTGALATA